MTIRTLLTALFAVFVLAGHTSHAHPAATYAKLFARQDGGGDGGAGNGGGAGSGGPVAGSPIPPDFTPWTESTANLTAWDALLANPSFGNLTSVAGNHSQSVVAALNSTASGTNLTVFAPYDGAWATVINNTLFQFANSTTAFDQLFTQVFAYHAANATQGTGAVYTRDWPAVNSTKFIPSLNGANLVLQSGGERPQAPVGFVGGGGGTAGPAQDGGDGGQGQATPPFFVDDGLIIFANQTVANGVIHVVDRVLNPAFAITSTTSTTTVTTTTTSATTTVTETVTTTETEAATDTETQTQTQTTITIPDVTATAPSPSPTVTATA